MRHEGELDAIRDKIAAAKWRIRRDMTLARTPQEEERWIKDKAKATRALRRHSRRLVEIVLAMDDGYRVAGKTC